MNVNTTVKETDNSEQLTLEDFLTIWVTLDDEKKAILCSKMNELAQKSE